ncbi:long-chain acyl-CoA synthetase [Moraxella cuniculi DSM 21768]|uniref:Long-chain-fatty-acid--CoA ligase n=1 Tax=Moraxella cuniculi DSM 21768 TaxID=1122245 RepID=A0A1N7D9S4_9GAMM|nr:AMP-binding protein [Moraxella cuniculi]OOS07923.1 long-chain fatty acid--CoA ligase [Moraxella cuniculi]SIR72504.1 long-chain acyl-CoA synthetase [Moraxella cuniculi DSM 21768]
MTDYAGFVTPDNRAWQATYRQHGLDIQLNMPKGINSLLDFFDENFRANRGQRAITFMGQHISYDELDKLSLKIAAYLQSLGLEQGDKVAVMMPNTPQYLTVMMGIVRAGFVLVNINPLYTASELEHQLADSDAKVLFIVENFAHTLEQVKNKAKLQHTIITGVGDMLGLKGLLINAVVRYVKKMVPNFCIPNKVNFKEILKSSHPYTKPVVNLDDVVILQYTGGTTGVAKGAMLTHGNLIANVYQCMTYVKTGFNNPYQHGEYMAVALPLYHIFSFMVAMLGMKMGFALLLIPNARDLDDLTKQFGKFRPQFFPAVNTLFNALTHHKGFVELDHSNLKVSLGGGMSVLPSTAANWEKITGNYIIEGYGLSETSPVLTFNPLGSYTGKIGIPFPSTDIILLDDEGNEVAEGEAGEICAKGPQVMKGYWKHDDETAKAMTADGYFRTGDIGVMDEQGYFKIVDRKKDMILVSGFNVYPNEVEAVIAACAGVLECGVVGVPDEHSGEAIKAFIVKQDAALTADAIKQWCKQNLTGYKRPKHIVFVEQLPKSNVGKILRKELRALA